MTDPTPVVTAVIATVGNERFDKLQACIRSLHSAAFTEPSLDVVVVVDGGQLDTDTLAAGLDHPVTVISTPKAGPAAARNVGWRHARSHLVAFVDDDTIVAPEWLGDIRRTFDEQADLAGLGGAIEPLSPRNPVSRMMTDMGHLNHTCSERRCRLLTANATYRRSALEAVGGFDERFTTAAGEDYDLSDRMWAAGLRLATTQKAVVYHHHPTSVTQMLSTARRYGAALPPHTTSARPTSLSGRVRHGLQRLFDVMVTRRAPSRVTAAIVVVVLAPLTVAQIPIFFLRARRAPRLPGVPTAAVESVLEVMWHLQLVHAVVANAPDGSGGGER